MFRRLSCLGIALLLSLAAGSAFGELLGYYPMNEGAGMVVGNASGYGHDGICEVEPNWVDGPAGFGTALHFDGSNPAPGWVNCGTWNPSEHTNQMTCAFWVQWGGPNGNWQGVVAKRDNYSSAEEMWIFEISQTNEDIFFGRIGQYPAGGGILPIGEWRHVAVACDGTTATFYVDGEETGSGVSH